MPTPCVIENPRTVRKGVDMVTISVLLATFSLILGAFITGIVEF
jgi:hypothetical protein